VSADYHVHMINSPDCDVTKDERILTMLAEGVDYFVASDHDFRTDLHPDIARLGAQERVASVVSEEITTFDLGHFNIWPLAADPWRRDAFWPPDGAGLARITVLDQAGQAASAEVWISRGQ
jgi:hypothetical protein